MGNVVFRKGIHRILEAAGACSDVVFLVVGKTNGFLHASYNKALMNRIVRERIENVRLLGYVDDGLLHDLYCYANAYLSPALSEACNLLLIEAAQYGIPIVATDVGAARGFFKGEDHIIPRHADVR